jgi:hypothetical protein
LTNNNPIINEHTIIVSPFAGESDICPRDESGSFYSVDFRGTDISWTQENLYRMTRALFPPNIAVLKQICWHGYSDALKFLQARSEWHTNVLAHSRIFSDMLQSTSPHPRRSISSMFGSEYAAPYDGEEEELANGGMTHGINQIYGSLSSDDDNDEDDDEAIDTMSLDPSEDTSSDVGSEAAFSPYCQKVTRKKELPSMMFAGKGRRLGWRSNTRLCMSF